MKTKPLFFLVLFFTIQVSISQTVNIPDANFELALINLGIDSNGLTGNILLSDATSANALNVSGKNISNLQGIEAFVNLTNLYCNNNNLSSIDISNITGLVNFQCANNQLSSLNLQSNPNLKDLHISVNSISNLDLSANTLLEYVSCDFNDLSSLDLSNNAALISLSCSQNSIATLNVINNNALVYLNFGNNNLSSIDISNSLLLEELHCHNNLITNLNISNNTLLEVLSAYNNGLRTINASENSLLSNFSLTNNQLVSVNIKNGNNASITSFSIQGNPNLTCVEVDDANYSNTNWPNIDAQTSFNESCPTIDIPDANFEQALIDLGYDTNGVTGDILQGEAEAITYLDVNGKSISSLQGIESFVNLETLDCYENLLTNLDLSNNTLLRALQCGENQLETLLVNNNPVLILLNTRNNNLTSLDVSSCVALEALNIYNNNIGSIDASSQPAFRFFLGENNNLSNLNVKNGNNTNITGFSVLNNPNLTCIEVDDVAYSDSNWTSIDAQTNFSDSCGPPTIAIPDPNFEQALIDAGFDTNGLNGNILETEAEAVTDMSVGFDIRSINNLQGIEGFINVVELNVGNNNLSSIDLSNNLNLEELHVQGNLLTSLDISNNPLLENLFCFSNLLINLDVSINTSLIRLECQENQLTNLDVSNNLALEHLVCYSNQLSSLDLSTNTALTILNCNQNQLESLNVKNGSNTNITTFNTTNNANLTCILVDNEAYSTASWTSIDAQTSFNDVECVLPTIAIPDANFEQALIDLGLDTNGLTGDILQSEAEAVTFLDVSDKSITSLQGIEGFINLATLHCQFNQLTSLDVSSNVTLVELSCHTNQITSLDFSNNLLLQRLYCSGNELTALDVSSNTSLTQLNCFSNQLQSLNVKNGNNANFILFNATNNPNLFCVEVDVIAYSETNWTNIDAQTSFNTSCSNLPVIAIPDVNFEQALIDLGFDTNGLNGNILQTEAEAVNTVLNVNNNNINSLQGIEGFINITHLICYSNNLITLDLSSNTSLTILECSGNNLSTLNIGNNVALQELSCIDNDLTSLDVSNNPLLTKITINDNSLSSLDLSNNLNLTVLYAHDNELVSLDVSNNPLLYGVHCNDNLLTSLDISTNTALVQLECIDNLLQTLNVKNGNNVNMTLLKATENPNLFCVKVDDVAYSTTNWSTDVDAQASFSENCSTILIPDPNFEQALINLGFDTNGFDGRMLQTDAEAVTLLDVSDKNISSLQGIEGFINLEVLTCYGNNISTLDLSSNEFLRIVSVTGNQISSLNISNNLALKELHINDNNLTNLDLSNNTALEELSCSNNSLTSLNVTNNSSLIALSCINNLIGNLDVSNNALLVSLDCRNNALNQLNVKNGNNANLFQFRATGNTNLTCIEVDDVAYSTTNWSTDVDAQANFSESCTTLAIPDINLEQALIDLGIDTNGLNGNIFRFQAEAIILLDVSNKNISSLQGIEGFINLEVLKCQDNNITSLNISNNGALQQLNCRNNLLTTLDVSANTGLETLNCFSNRIIDLDLSNNETLKFLLCDDNDLESLNIKNGNNEDITFFSALNNSKLNCIEVDNLAYSNTNWSNNIDAQTSFSEDCGATLTINEVNTLDNVKLYPNPTSVNFFIKGLQENTTIKIYDMNSKLIMNRIINNNEAINISDIQSGIYFINISNSTGNTVKKLIIQ